eukprot:5584178-Karenia_brevis.AAC.1
MHRCGLSLFVICFNAAILACEKGGQWQRVAPLQVVIRISGLSLSVISFIAAISACEKGGQWRRVAPVLFLRR